MKDIVAYTLVMRVIQSILIDGKVEWRYAFFPNEKRELMDSLGDVAPMLDNVGINFSVYPTDRVGEILLIAKRKD